MESVPTFHWRPTSASTCPTWRLPDVTTSRRCAILPLALPPLSSARLRASFRRCPLSHNSARTYPPFAPPTLPPHLFAPSALLPTATTVTCSEPTSLHALLLPLEPSAPGHRFSATLSPLITGPSALLLLLLPFLPPFLPPRQSLRHLLLSTAL